MTRLPARVATLAAAAALAVALPGAATAAAGKRTAGDHSPSACRPSSVAATLDLADTASSSSSPAGAVIFRDLSKAACTLEGVPVVTAKAAGGSSIDLYEESVPHQQTPAVLTPGGSGKAAAASITWSSWGCARGSYSLGVRFSGWASGLTVSSGKSATAPTCSEMGQTVYVGAVAPYRG